MTTKTPDELINALMDMIVETIEEVNGGVPGGYIYTALMHGGCSLETYNRLMQLLVKEKRLVKRGELYFIPDGKEKLNGSPS